jgi:hypothetical protein
VTYDEVRAHLCWYDPRSPYVPAPRGDGDEIPAPRHVGCGCDPCFQGRDKLAVEIIRLRELLEKKT